MIDFIVTIIILSATVAAIVCSFRKLYKDYNKPESSDTLNDDFDEHTDQFII